MTSPWEVFYEGLPLVAAPYGGGLARTVAVGLRGGGLVVVSPGPRADEARAALERWGPVRFLLAPNHFHNAGLAEWASHCPSAAIVAHPNAHARLHKKVPGVAIGDLEALRATLPEGTRLLSLPMAKQGETWLAVHAGPLRALVVCDAVTNMSRTTAVTWLLGFRARLMTNPFFKRVFLTDKQAYKEWMLAELSAHPPNLFIPAHGKVLLGDEVAKELERVTACA